MLVLEVGPFTCYVPLYQEVPSNPSLITIAWAGCLVRPGFDALNYFLFYDWFSVGNCKVLVEALQKIFLPFGLVGALEQMVLVLCLVAPDAIVGSGGSKHVHALSSWQPSMGETGGESFQPSIALAGCGAGVEIYQVHCLVAPSVALLHVLLQLLAWYRFLQLACFFARYVLSVGE